jgi:hypothetical protein
MKSYDTLSEAINDLQKTDYTYDFNLAPECLKCASLKIEIRPQDFKVDEIYRFEGMSSTDDNAFYTLFLPKTELRVFWLMPTAYMQRIFQKQ